MSSAVVSLLHSLRLIVRSRASLHLEIVALRHQLAVVNRWRRPRLHLTSARFLWAWLAHAWRDWRTAVHIVKPETIVTWHRRGFRLFWTWKSLAALCHERIGSSARQQLGRATLVGSCSRARGLRRYISLSSIERALARNALDWLRSLDIEPTV